MQPNIQRLKVLINSGKFPTDFPHFGGANLIITNDPSYVGFERDKVILTEHASAISWLISELKKVYSTKINVGNKYDFYPAIGAMIEISVKYNDDIFETLNYILDESQKFWDQE